MSLHGKSLEPPVIHLYPELRFKSVPIQELPGFGLRFLRQKRYLKLQVKKINTIQSLFDEYKIFKQNKHTDLCEYSYPSGFMTGRK